MFNHFYGIFFTILSSAGSRLLARTVAGGSRDAMGVIHRRVPLLIDCQGTAHGRITGCSWPNHWKCLAVGGASQYIPRRFQGLVWYSVP